MSCQLERRPKQVSSRDFEGEERSGQWQDLQVNTILIARIYYPDL
jgi:hypothetical protein